MFVHSPGEELWLLFTDFPRLVENIRLPFKTDQEISLITVLLSELKTTQINREHLPCKNYKNELEFTVCGKKALWKMIGSKINCTIPGLKEIIPLDSDIPKCDSFERGRETYNSIKSISSFTLGLPNLNCDIPCTHKSFNVQIKFVHKNAYIDVDGSTAPYVNTTVALAIHYNSLLVEERSEAYIYDFESLMTSIGGNLGLFLGFSCFSTIMFVVKYVFRSQVIFPK